ncbi:phage head-binding domain-containing protein [Escherichia coli]|uniref:phage head-binding domain-containing protein n=1 Tax=Escherichia coli TaxID=562 RepID=UPI0006A15F15|nr:phage head-binding domain-containing protein [Escherichia coli]CTU04593.1 putative tail spike protein [Escherichia coli]
MTDITANVIVSMPSQLFTMARSFKAVANGKIYIGKIDTDPVNPENQIQVYVENEDGSHVPVSQPIIINAAGYPVYNGQITKFVTEQGHSMAVYDAYGARQFYFPNVLKYDPDQFSQQLASFDPPGTNLIGTKGGVNLTQYLDRVFMFIDDLPGVDKSGVLDSSAALNTAITTYSGVGVEFIGNPSSTYLLTGTVQCIGVSNITLNFNGAKIMDNVQGFIPTSGGRANHTFVVYNSKKVRISNFVYDVAETRADATASNPSAPQTVMIWVGGQYLGSAMTSDVEIDRIYNVTGKGLNNGFVVCGMGELDGIRLHDCLISGGPWKFGCNFEYGLAPENPATNSTMTNGLHPYNIHVERFNVENVSTCDGWWRVASCYNAYFLNITAYNTKSACYCYSGDRGITRYSQNVIFENMKIKFSDDTVYANSSVQIITTDKDGSTGDPLPSWSNFDHTFMFINCEVQSTKVDLSTAYRIFGNMGKVHILGGNIDSAFRGLHAQPAINPSFFSDGAIIVDGVILKNCFQFMRIGSVKGMKVQNCTFKAHLWGSSAASQLDPVVVFNNADATFRSNWFDAMANSGALTYINAQACILRLRDNDFTMKSVAHYPITWSGATEPTLYGSGNKYNSTLLIPAGVNDPQIYGEPCPSKPLESLTGSVLPFSHGNVWISSATKSIDTITGGKPGDRVVIRGVSLSSSVTFIFSSTASENRIVPLSVGTETKTGNGWSKTFIKMSGAQGWWEV